MSSVSEFVEILPGLAVIEFLNRVASADEGKNRPERKQ